MNVLRVNDSIAKKLKLSGIKSITYTLRTSNSYLAIKELILSLDTVKHPSVYFIITISPR